MYHTPYRPPVITRRGRFEAGGRGAVDISVGPGDEAVVARAIQGV